MIFTCVPDIHNDWVALINLAANSLIAKPYAFEIPYTCFCGGDKAIFVDNLIENAANKPWVCAFFTCIPILAGDLLNCGVNLWHRLSVCKIEVSHRSKRSQSAIIIFAVVILVKTTKILELNYQAITLLYDLLLQMVRVGRLERPISTSQMWRLTNQAIPGYILGFAPCARRVERRGLRTRTSLHLAGYYRSPKYYVILISPPLSSTTISYLFHLWMEILFKEGLDNCPLRFPGLGTCGDRAPAALQ